MPKRENDFRPAGKHRTTTIAAVAAAGLAFTAAASPALATGAAGAATTDALRGFTVRDAGENGLITDNQGRVWAPTGGYASGARTARSPHVEVAGTDDDTLYQTQRYGMNGWSTPVPGPGEYTVRLLMADLHWTQPGQRVFDVSAEGRTVAEKVDLVAQAGPKTAHEVKFTTTVNDGVLNLGFVASVDNATVAAIEVTPADGEAPDAATVRWGAGSSMRLAPNGTVWRKQPNLSFPVATQKYSGRAIRGTHDPELYWTQKYGMKEATIPVSVAGTYRVRIEMAELFWDKPGARVFDITAEGQAVAEGVDIYSAVGKDAAHHVEFTTTVTDGTLNLGFDAQRDNAIFAGISVTPVSAPTPDPSDPEPDPAPEPGEEPKPADELVPAPDTFVSRMVASPTPVTDGAGNVWGRWSATLGSNQADRGLAGIDIAGTDEDDVFRTYALNPSGYALDVPGPGTYRVRLLMVENTYWDAGRRIFDVLAEGRTVLENIDITAAVGPRHAYERTFDVNVNDNVLDLAFTASKGQPTISAIEVTALSDVVPQDSVGPNYPGLPFPMFKDGMYVKDISNAPVAHNSDHVGAHLAKQVSSRYGGHAAFNVHHFNVAVNVADENSPRVDLKRVCEYPNPTITIPNLYDGYGHFTNVPVPNDAMSAKGTDGEMTIYDPATDQLWEFWQMARDDQGQWGACWGGRIDDFSKKEAVFPSGFGASASGLAIAPGMITVDDVRRGKIEHAMIIGVPESKADEFSWPANRTDGLSHDEHAPVQGQRLRLRSDIDLDSYNLTPVGRMVAEAAQKYGFVVTDTAGAVAITGEATDAIVRDGGEDPWDRYLGDGAWSTLRDFPWHEIEALPVDYGKPVE